MSDPTERNRDKLDELNDAIDGVLDKLPIPDDTKKAIDSHQNRLFDKFRALPIWAHVLAYVLVALGSYAFSKYVLKDPTPEPILIFEKQGADGRVEIGTSPAIDAQAGPIRQRIFANYWRNKVETKLRYDGLSSVGGKRTLTEAEIQVYLAKLTDQRIVSAAQSPASGVSQSYVLVGAPGPVLQFFIDLLSWVREHPDQVDFFLKILMMLLTLL